MSIIKRYQAALRHRTNPRYMTKDFVVPLYTGTEPEILDDSNTQRESSVYKEFPNDMPIISPKDIQNQPYEQLELADGGRVSFKKGGKVIENNYLFNFMKENSGISNFEKAKKLNKLGFRNSQGGRITDNLLEKFVTQNQELKGLGTKSAKFTLEELKQYARPKQLQDFESGLIDEETFRTRVTQYRGDLKKTPEQKILARQTTYQNILADPERKAKMKEARLKYNEKRYLEQGMYPPSKNPKDALWRDLLRSANVDDRVSLVSKRPNKYPRDVFQSIKLKDNETDKIISYKNLNNHPEYNKAIKPYQIKFAINQSELSPETRKKITYQRTEGGNKSNIVIQHNQGLGKNPFNTSLAIQGENIQESLIRNRFEKRFNDAETLSDKKQAINLFKKDLEKKAPNIISQPGKKAYGVETDAEGLLKTSKVPAGERRRLVQMIGSIGCPTYAIGGRVNFSEGTDCYNKGLKALEEGNLTRPQLNVAGRAIAESGEEGTVLKNILSKAGTGIKFTGRGVTELISIGGGPAGVVAGAALETAFALPYLAEGDYKQALRQSIFGQVPELLGFDVGSRSEDVLKIAKEAGANYDLVKKYVELEKNMREQDEIVKKLTVLDELKPRYANNPGGVADIDLQIKRLENKLKPSEEYLSKNVYSPKEFNQFTDEYLKAGKYFINKNYEKTLPIFNKSEEAIKKSQSELFKESVTPIVGEDQSEKLLKQKGVLYEEPVETEIVPEELPSEYKVSAAEGGYIDYIKDYNKYARGGRIHLSEGGKGPRIGRRGFLGFLLGAAAAPFVGKLMKGKKVAQGAKVVGKVLPKVSGMPEWFSPLVSRIQKEGIDVSPKATRVEDIIKVKKLEVPAPDGKSNDIVTMTEYPDGRIDIEANVYGGSFDSPFSLEYRPPRSDINLDTGAEIKSPGDFTVVEQRPRPESGNPGKIEIDYESMSVDDTISDLERLEGIGTGKRINPRRVQQRAAARKYIEDNPHEDVVNRYPDGEIYYDQMKDEGLLDE